MKHLVKLLSLGAALVAASAPMAFATPIVITNNNATTNLTGATGTPVNTGTVYSSSTFLNSGTFTGTLVQSAFYDSSSLFTCSGGKGCLTFSFQFTNNNATGDTVEGVNTGSVTGGFSGFLTAAGYVAGSGTAPSTVMESTNGKVTFNFNPGFYGASNTFFIQTNATNFAPGLVTVTDFQSANTTGVVPSAATPEPSSLIMLGTGLVSAAGMLVRRRRIS